MVPHCASIKDRAHEDVVTVDAKHDAEHEQGYPVEKEARRLQVDIEEAIGAVYKLTHTDPLAGRSDGTDNFGWPMLSWSCLFPVFLATVETCVQM